MMLTLLWLSILTTAVWAAPFQTELEGNVNLQLGTKSVPSRAIDDDLTTCSVSFTRNQWTNAAAKLRLRIEYSRDAGKTWDFVEGTAEGGTLLDNPTVITLPLQPGTGRLIRGTYEVSGARFRTTAALRCD